MGKLTWHFRLRGLLAEWLGVGALERACDGAHRYADDIHRYAEDVEGRLSERFVALDRRIVALEALDSGQAAKNVQTIIHRANAALQPLEGLQRSAAVVGNCLETVNREMMGVRNEAYSLRRSVDALEARLRELETVAPEVAAMLDNAGRPQ